MSQKDVRETLGLLLVVASLCFVGWEVRQNTIAARASAYQEMGADLQSSWQEAASDPLMAELFMRFIEDPAAQFSPVEEDMLVAFWIGGFRQYEATWRQVELGLLRPADLEMFGWGSESPGASANLRKMWPRIRALMSPDFADYMDRRLGVAP